jgi:hypothetical protein
MGMHPFPARMLGKIPTYYVSEVIKEDAGDGNVRILNYARKKGVLVPEFEVIMSSAKLLLVGRTLSEFAQEIFNSEQIRGPGMKVH